jgi:hypothetical protein
MTALLRALALLLVALLPGVAAADVLEEIGVFADKGDAVVRLSFGVSIQYLRHATPREGLVEIYFRVLTADRLNVIEERRIPATPTFPGVEAVFLRQARSEIQRVTVRFTSPVAVRVRPSGNRAIDLVVPGAAGKLVRAPAVPDTAVPEIEKRAAELMVAAQAALDAGRPETAVERLNELLLLPPNRQSQQAQELVGVARERTGEIAKARAEYELYLRLYPKGEGAARVRARLAALPPPDAKPARAPRAPLRSLTGTLSQYYYRGDTKIESVFNTPTTPDRSSFSLTDQSALVTNIDLTARNRTAGSDNRLVLRDTYSKSFLEHPESYNRLNAAYYDYRGLDNTVSARLGRQSGFTGGLPNRFDGALAGVGIAQNWRASAAIGLPVEYPEIEAKRQFWTASLEFDNLAGAWSGNFFITNQTVDGIRDRQAVGNETRYLSDGLSVFTLLDYDMSFEEWNITMLQGTWQSEKRVIVNFMYDRRRAPLLATTNAILGQGTTSIATLLETMTEEQLRQQALDVTAIVTQAQLGFTVPLGAKWQAGADARLTNVGALPAIIVNGIEIPAQPATGNIYTYDFQLIGTNLYSARDTSVLALTLLDGPAQTGHQVSYSNLSMLGRWTLEPSLRYYAQDDIAGISLTRWTPGLRLSYRIRETLALEGEASWERTRTVGPASQEDTSRQFFFVGYRWDL